MDEYWKYIFFGGYLVILVLMGLYTRRSAKTTSGFVLGDRQFGPVITAMGFMATAVSAVVIINSGMVGWNWGTGALWNGIIQTIFVFGIVWLVLAKPTRRVSGRLHALTMPVMLAGRYKNKWITVVGALMIFVFLVPYAGSVFTAVAYLITYTFGFDYIVIVVAVSVILGLYMVLGGYNAAVLSDLLQGFCMVIGILMVAYYVINSPEVGGWEAGIAALEEVDPNLVRWDMGGIAPWIAILPLFLMVNVANLGQPQTMTKFFAIRNEKFIPRAMVICFIVGGIVLVCSHIPGFFSHVFFDEIPIGPAGTPTMDVMAPMILAKCIPSLPLAFIAVCILSATMSTLDGLIITASSAIAVDLVGTIRPQTTDKQKTVILRVCVVVFTVTAMVIAIFRPAAVIGLMSLSFGSVAGFFFAPYVFAVLWKRGTWPAVFVSGVVCVGIAIIGPTCFGMSSLDTMPWILLAAVIVFPVASLVTQKFAPEREFVDALFEKKPTPEEAAAQLKAEQDLDKVPMLLRL